MRDYNLSKEKIAELEKLHRSLRDKRQADRVKAVIALSKGWSPSQVAEILLFDEKTSRHYKGENDPVYFADATHPQHNSVPSYGWIKKGKEKQLKANCGRQRLNINGAIDIETLEPVVGFYDTINAQATIDLFGKIQAKHPDADVIYIIIDNARYYRSKLLKQYVNGTKLKLVFLPPYSPNLNLIERYWKFFKKNVLNNHYYETFGEFKLACKSFFRKRKKYLPELQTLLAENFHIQAAWKRENSIGSSIQ